MTVRPFSVPTVLRSTPNELLQQCFQELGHGDSRIPWLWLKHKEIDPIQNYLDSLPLEERNAIEGVLRNVFELANEPGYRAILEAAPHCAVYNLPALVPEDLSISGRVMWVWLHQRPTFEKALIINQVEQLSWWRKRNDLPKEEPDTSPSAKRALANDISHLFKDQGRGKDCSVEVMSRDCIDYFFVHPDDFVKNVTVHDQHGKLTDEPIRQTFLVVFAYNRSQGTLETFARLPKKEKERLEWIFASNILGVNLPPHEPEPAYELDHLKDPMFLLETDAADLLSVHIRKMRLEPPNGRRTLIEINDQDSEDSIHCAIHDCLNLEYIPLERWAVSMVTICFEFRFKDGRKPGQVSVDISYPHSAGLRGIRPERLELIQKYLKRWGIERVADADEDDDDLGDQSPSSKCA
ncbi:hypothetical protein ETAA8_40560 [Anatilimnocola aggregata]|uniref:Uncharacterized protein n=1 Tax=Anatilimnocola aggregata TaxID=2528021 RepID=A0A517YFE5_9BACT|nr:hypothetical protein [Anatilimnocola aggregata]QDU28950.1 hypothetical protein ETAA8_40560 [Anatilimnocola aggregata]